MSTPGVEDAIAPLVADGLVVAVGTVRDARDVARLADAGASLVVSFWNPPGFVAAAEAAGIAAIPGGFTAHELAAELTQFLRERDAENGEDTPRDR